MTYEQMLGRITDMRQLTVLPENGEKSGCVSSYDRRSRYDEASDTYLDWGANDDGHGVEAYLDDGSVLALELHGAGIIWRSWSAMPGSGAIRVYVDGEKAPVIERPFIDYFTRFGDDFAPLNLPSLCPRISRGYNSFLPIPFAKSIRIEFDKDWGAYYHFTYTLFPNETQMPSYKDHFSKENRIALAALDRRLYQRGHRGWFGGEWQPASTFYCDGMGAITAMEMRLTEGTPAALRGVLIKMYWDGEAVPSVCVPLPDFFGCGPNPSATYTWPLGQDEHRFYANWVMPFATGARVEIENISEKNIRLEWRFTVKPETHAEKLLRFHSKWHRDTATICRFPDWPLLAAANTKGRFCGIHLHVHNTFHDWSPGEENWWWGEGDEKFFVDGERFPSTFGTGSEDYIGYAWAADAPFALFDSPFAANASMPLDGNGDSSVCRFHVCDNIPFQNGFEGYIEKYHDNIWGKNRENRCYYSATAFWYQVAGTKDIYHAPPAEELFKYL